MLLKRIGLYIGVLAVIILSACSGASTEEKIHDHLEEVVQLEAGFEEQQDEIVKLEKQEQKIYEQVATLESSEFDEIKKLAKEAIESIEKRSDKVSLEKESIDDAREEFEKTKPLIDKLEDKEVKEKAEEMYGMMIDRYDAYNELHDAYLVSLKEETTLYTLLQKEDLAQEEFTEQISGMNDVYEQVIQKNEEMNTATNKYNKLKEEFYSIAELEGSSKED